MRRRFVGFFFGTFVSGSGLALAVACGPSSSPSVLPVTDEPDSGRRPPHPGTTSGIVDPPDPLNGPDASDPPLPDGGKPPGRIYGNTADTLYRYDPLAGTLVMVGRFDCVPHGDGSGFTPDDDDVIDIALDRSGQMYGTTFWRFIQIDAASGHCTVKKLQDRSNLYPNSLAFVPLGTVDPTQEALVGYTYDPVTLDARVYSRINVDTGELTVIGDINPVPPLGGIEYKIAGDFVSLARAEGTTYGSIVPIADAGATDLLAELDPATGAIKRIIGDIGQGNLYGMGFWAGKAYGFSSLGGIYQISPLSGGAQLALDPADGGPIEWYGAGVTTDSPTAP